MVQWSKSGKAEGSASISLNLLCAGVREVVDGNDGIGKTFNDTGLLKKGRKEGDRYWKPFSMGQEPVNNWCKQGTA